MSSTLLVKLTLAVVCFAIVALAAGHVASKKTGARTTSAATDTGTLAKPEQKKATTLMESELITVSRRGFQPSTITRPQGRFLLMIENPDRQDLDLHFSRATGEPLHQIRASRNEPDWNDIQDLPAGRYVLTEQGHPQWTCLITITAR